MEHGLFRQYTMPKRPGSACMPGERCGQATNNSLSPAHTRICQHCEGHDPQPRAALSTSNDAKLMVLLTVRQRGPDGTGKR